MLSYPAPWREAWVEAAYGRDGFWTLEGPGRHFRSACSIGSLMAESVADLLAAHPEVGAVLDLGTGDGLLLADLRRLNPDLRLIGTDLRARPETLPAGIEWCVDRWDVVGHRWSFGVVPRAFARLDGPALVLAVEWLDDLPCPIAQTVPGGWRYLEVSPGGMERLGSPLDAADEAWVRRWWPTGHRPEVGAARDIAWAGALAALPHGGLGLMIDYGHTATTRPPHGSLAGYRRGRRVSPRPDGRCNLTAGLAIDAVAEAGRHAGATTVRLDRQATALGEVERSFPGTAVLAGLERRSQTRVLTGAGGLAERWWLLQSTEGVTA